MRKGEEAEMRRGGGGMRDEEEGVRNEGIFSYFQPCGSGSGSKFAIPVHKVSEYRYNFDPDPQH